MVRRSVLIVVLLIGGGLLPACVSPTSEMNFANDHFELSISASTLTIPAGNIGSLTVTVQRQVNFTDPIVLSFDNGSACSVSPGTVASNQTTAVVTCSSFTPGTTPVTVLGKDGNLTASVAFSLIVT